MNENPFYVAPLGGMNLTRAAQPIFGAIQQNREEAKALEQQNQQKQLIENAQQVFSSGSPKDMADFVIANPQFRDVFKSAQGYMSETTEAMRRDGLRRIAMGEDTKAVALEVADEIEAAGGTADITRSFADLTPEEAKRKAEEFQATLFPEDWKQMQKVKASRAPEPEAERQVTKVGNALIDNQTGKVIYKGEDKPGKPAKPTKEEVKTIATAKKMIASSKKFEDLIYDPDFAGAVGMLDQYTAAVGAQFGSKEGVLNKKAKRASRQLVLEAAGQLSGALSDADIMLLKESAPDTGDSPEVWTNWYETEFKPTVERAAKEAGIEFNSGRGVDSDDNRKKFPNAPDVGTIKGGYEYTGGDPRDQANWSSI